jgi:predicted TIM-barrel fold metal-dependent hydrolase
VLSKASDIPIQIAHLAGWGGYDKQTDEALTVFANYSAENNLNENIYFDLSAVIRPVRNQGDSTQSNQTPKWYPEERYQRLTQQIKKVGLDRILFGTDWPDWNPQHYKNDIINNLKLSNKELDIIFNNKAPWFK